MAEPHASFKPKRLSLISATSPTRHRPADDLLVHLAPAVAAEALASPSGALKACLDAAPPADRDFAMRAALASRRIWEWLRELEDWAWPAGGPSAGFEKPNGRQRNLSLQATAPAPDGPPDDHLGCLPAPDVARYEDRVDEIHRDLDALAVEDLKSHVLTNHIMPLSRPATPATDSNRFSPASSSSYNKMEDPTALVTGIVLQMLPTLARLSHLLRIWGIRLRVLRCIPLLLGAIQDAQVGLKSGWAAITSPSASMSEHDQPPPLTLKRADFEVMRHVNMSKVAEPGRMLDYMLDCVEWMQDTLPHWWLDQIEAVERGYGEWVAACETKMREADWAVSAKGRTVTKDAVTFPQRQMQDKEMETDGKSPTGYSQHTSDESPTASSDSAALDTPSDQGSLDYDGSSEARAPSAHGEPPSLMADEASCFRSTMPVVDRDAAGDSLYLGRPKTPVEEQDEPELPPLRARASRNSIASQASTVMNGTSSHFGALSSDPPEVSASPGLPRTRVHEAAFVDDSPPSSPPLPRADMLEPPPALLDSTVIGPIPEGEESMFFKTPADQSFVDEFDDTLSMSDMTSSMMRRESSSDQQLRQQISEIIESIPAKIKRLAEAPPVNLNPPDIQLPRLRRRTSKEAVKRSASNLSALSSRTVTPSFTLSPAKNPRPRAQRAQQDIKAYHLSRSTGEPPIKLFIRCVGEHGERVMVRVGGGWADLSEYLEEYASHHGRRSAGSEKARVEVRDIPPRASSGLGVPLAGSSPSAKSEAAAAESSLASPFGLRKTRLSGGSSGEAPRLRPKTPAGAGAGCSADNPPSSGDSTRSRSSSRLSWVDDDSSFLGLAGPTGKKIEMSEENRAWVESVKEKVRLVSGERRASAASEDRSGRFGKLGKVGATKRLFPKADDRSWR